MGSAMRLKGLYVSGIAIAFLMVIFIAAKPTMASAQVSFDRDSYLTPEILVERVLSENASLPQVEEAARAVAARVEPAGALADPVFTYAIAPNTIGVRELDTGQRIELSQSLPWPGKLDAREQGAQAQARISPTLEPHPPRTVLAI